MFETVNIFNTMLKTSLSIATKGVCKIDVNNLIKMWISLIAKGKNFDNFCMPQWNEPSGFIEMETKLSKKGNKIF